MRKFEVSIFVRMFYVCIESLFLCRYMCVRTYVKMHVHQCMVCVCGECVHGSGCVYGTKLSVCGVV